MDFKWVVYCLRVKKFPWRFLSRWNKAINYLDHITYHTSHILREWNQIADNLASYAVHIVEDVWWFNAPTTCSSLYDRDLTGLLK